MDHNDGLGFLKDEEFRLKPPAAQVLSSTHPPRILVLHGSLRAKSFSRLLSKEVERILVHMGAEVKSFDPNGLPMFDQDSHEHPKVKELRDLSIWSEGQAWVSPEMHGNVSGVMKNQIDWIPLTIGSVRPTQGRTLAVFEVSGGSQSFNAVNTLRVLGRWMRMITIPNQSSVAQAYNEFEEDGAMKASSYRDRVVDVVEELMRMTYLTRDVREFLVDRYSERKEQVSKIDLKKL